MLPIIATLLLMPFVLEAFVQIGFDRPRVKRHPLFYIGAPLTSLFVYGSYAALLGHPVITFGAWAFTYVGMTLVSNIKNRILGEPIVAHDLETTRHLFIYPEFYVDYVGAGRVITIFGSFAAAVITACVLETSFASHQLLLPAWAAWAFGLVFWVALMTALAKLLALVFTAERSRALGFTHDVNTDVARFGYFPLMVWYGIQLLAKLDNPALKVRRPALTPPQAAPDLIAIQAESYFDIDRLYRRIPGYEGHRWQPLEALRAAGAATGRLRVPAWGASTMKSEFAFLTGTDNGTLGIDSLNPYQRAAYRDVETLATRLRTLGYRTVCIHPAKKEFFRRSTVIPLLGFEDFIGIEAFEGADRFGPYVSDTALVEVIEQTIADHRAGSDQPLFLFTITIESHGPWDAGRLSKWLDEDAITAADPSQDRSFALYHQHMDNVLKLFDRLGPQAADAGLDRPRALVMYGDHQPACHELFSHFGFDDRTVDYVLWHSETEVTDKSDLSVDALGDTLLRTAGFGES